MELTESDKPSSSSSSPLLLLPRSILAIDLNQIPSPSETLPSPSSSSTPLTLSPASLVRSIHDNPPPAEGPPAEIPDDCSPCSGCGAASPVVPSDRLVCDGCERGFHFGCAGVAAMGLLDEWVCRDCAGEGVSSRRWPLGRKKKEGGVRLLDMNASPPSDGDGETTTRTTTMRDSGGGGSCREFRDSSFFSGYTSGGPLPYSNIIYSGNGYGHHKASTIVTHTLRLDFQDILHHRHSTARSFEDIAYASQLGRIRSSNTTFKLPPWNPSEVLQSLREFISERHGILEDGWRVEFKQSKIGCESYAVYCAPDGKMFETMSDVACYLGLMSNGNSVELETRSDDGSALRRNGLHLPKRRKLTRLPIGNGFTESRNSMTSSLNNGLSSNVQNEQFLIGTCGKKVEVRGAVEEEKGTNDFHQFHERLPLQYEDLFILSLGKVDTRASYHDTTQIWPVGYRSCWHDKITGSLFLCDVLDGGDTGPIFKVRRFSCSALPIPYGSTVLHRKSCVELDCPNKEKREKVNTADDECFIDMILSEPCFPVEGDTLSWLLRPAETDGQQGSLSRPEVHSSCERSKDLLAHNSPVGEKIDEFSVDGHSASSVWSILSQKLADACYQLYNQTGSLKFFCKHVEDGISSFDDIMNEKNKEVFSSLDKFCSLLGSVKVPPVVNNDGDFDVAIEGLKNWVNPDRFGLDVAFVQELIEQCPEAQKCSQYEFLRRRSDCLRSPLVGNGLLLINGRSLEQCKEDTVFDCLYRKYKIDGESAVRNYSRPPGKQLGAKLPPHLVGDVLQVWELLCRFHEILGLDPLSFDELEAELISPWFENLSQNGSCEKSSPSGQVISADGSSILSEQTSSSSSEAERPQQDRFIEMETAVMREEAHARLAFSTYIKCACVSLRRAVISLLDVLVSELQIKAAAVMDPSIDGESKSRRGRRRDVDSSILAIRRKLNLLPINEFTWPELARRYILAVLSMDGNLDSGESGVRECGKVYRCLQGDGGVLCGSLVGVAGIEADALLLAEATKRIYGSPSRKNDLLIMEDDDPEPVAASGMTAVTEGNVPEWAQALEPVRKLPTNVGTRIRRCVHEALAKDPPEWARKILEHSISKEVYKGNASGPTKKAVLSVLADVLSEGSQQKIRKETKKKTIVSISDIIMRQCRILLRHAASADEEKVFCNLLGRNLMNSSENDEEGLLGSPAMVSRPLDFRTIDLRLAVGSYGGSHEAFLEDVRELWKNIRTAHAEQLDLVQLAEDLSQKFESLYDEEVVALVKKLEECSESEQISAERKKEIRDLLASTNEIPKAPWDEGVCKVCGIDKDDDSVLLCDTCDAEYHTYCLNPPLARIPEGNWYCPSCVSGISILEVTSKGAQFIGQKHRRKYHGEGIRNYTEEIAQLAAVLEQKEYWEFSVDERILLLKFLCDEVLNSILIRQHLEQSSEISVDLQQKLRLLYSEWKNLKVREDVLATKAAKLGLSIPHVPGDANMNPQANYNIGAGLQSTVSEKSDQIVTHLEKNVSCDSEVKKPEDKECQVKDIVKAVNEDISPYNHDLHERSSKRLKTSSLHESSLPYLQPRETSGLDGESARRGKNHEHDRPDVSAACKSEDLQGVSVSPSVVNTVTAEGGPCCPSNELQAYNHDLNAVQKDLSSLQLSIASAESQLLKSFVRMEFLGSDSSGRLYWISAQPGAHPWVIVDGTIALQPKTQGVGHATMVSDGSSFEFSLEGSSAACPFVYSRDCSTPTHSQWTSYQSEAEIKELIKSLNNNDPKERELTDSILHWQKLRFHEFNQTGKQDQVSLVGSMSAKENDMINLPGTKASSVLEHRYGPFFQEDTLNHLKKHGKRSKVSNDDKLHRCKCLEPIWILRQHCRSCHRTFFTAEELDKHKFGKCSPSPSVSGRKKPISEPQGGLDAGKSQTQEKFARGADIVQTSKGAVASEFSELIKYQNEGFNCPYKFEEISSKFVTNDSIKELVHGIGLIGSEGTPSFLPSVSPYLSDPALMLAHHPREDAGVADDQQHKIPEKAAGRSEQVTGEVVSPNTHSEKLETGQSLEGIREEKSSVPNKFASPVAIDAYCTVPKSSLRPLVGRAAQLLRQLKISLLDMEAALPEEAFKESKGHPEKRRAWHAFVKAAATIFEMVQATIVLENAIKTEYLKNEWWYWSSLSAAAKTSTLSSLALRIFALDNAIIYDRTESSDQNQTGSLKPSVGEADQQVPFNLDSSDNKSKSGRRANKKRKEADG